MIQLSESLYQPVQGLEDLAKDAGTNAELVKVMPNYDAARVNVAKLISQYRGDPKTYSIENIVNLINAAAVVSQGYEVLTKAGQVMKGGKAAKKAKEVYKNIMEIKRPMEKLLSQIIPVRGEEALDAYKKVLAEQKNGIDDNYKFFEKLVKSYTK